MVKDTNILVIAPHADDEAFGCGGTIAKWTSEGSTAKLVVMGVGIGKPDELRFHECMKASGILGFYHTTQLFPKEDASLDTIPQKIIVQQLDEILDNDRYNYVFIPCPSHHKDHKVTYEASMAALRLGAHPSCNVLMYEYPYPDYSISGGKFYVDISKTINKKLQAIAAYQSCIKKYPHPASSEAAENVATMRGMAIQVRYAEMFHVIQMIGD
jgi:LmbE family N-acetylglucosaminyl deacetylase